MGQDTYRSRLKKMSDESLAMAEKYGISKGELNGPQDAFRHAYMSAKVTHNEGSSYARVVGTANEWKNEIQSRLDPKNGKGNPSGEWNMDELNNLAGREIGKKAKEEGWSDERIAQEVKKAMEAGKLVQEPREPDGRTITPTRPDGFMEDKNKPRPSILDYYVKALKESGEE